MAEWFSLEDRTYRIISILIDCLNGMPSILYGLYGFLFFVVFMGIGYSLLSGILVLIILILPMIIRISEKAFRSVFCMYRETGEALGISRVSMLRHVVMPQAFLILRQVSFCRRQESVDPLQPFYIHQVLWLRSRAV